MAERDPGKVPRVDCIYNRSRGRNLVGRPAPRVRRRGEEERVFSRSLSQPSNQTSNQASTPVSRAFSEQNSKSTIPSTPKPQPNFDIYLNNKTSHIHPLRQQSCPVLVRQQTDSPQSFLTPPDPLRQIRNTVYYAPSRTPKTSVVLADPGTRVPGIRLTTASPPNSRTGSTESWSLETERLLTTGVKPPLCRMSSQEGPLKNADKTDSMDISEVEAEYFKQVKLVKEEQKRKDSPPTFPLYVNKLSELFEKKKHLENFLKSEFKYVAVSSGNFQPDPYTVHSDILCNILYLKHYPIGEL